MMQAPTSPDISRLQSRIAELTPSSIDLLARLLPIIERYETTRSSGMIHIGFKDGCASKLRIDTEYTFE